MSVVLLTLLLTSIVSSIEKQFDPNTNASGLTNGPLSIRRRLTQIVDQGLKDHIVTKHNEYRRIIAKGNAHANNFEYFDKTDNTIKRHPAVSLPAAKNMYQLNWDDDLALSAATYAGFCSKGIHSDKWDADAPPEQTASLKWGTNENNIANRYHYEYGENMLTRTLTRATALETTYDQPGAIQTAIINEIRDATSSWFKEIQLYRGYNKFESGIRMMREPFIDPRKLKQHREDPRYTEVQVDRMVATDHPNLLYRMEDTGHFEQLIWAAAQRIGCGYAHCHNAPIPWVQVVCQYDVVTRWGEFPYHEARDGHEQEIASECEEQNDGLCVETERKMEIKKKLKKVGAIEHVEKRALPSAPVRPLPSLPAGLRTAQNTGGSAIGGSSRAQYDDHGDYIQYDMFRKQDNQYLEKGYNDGEYKSQHINAQFFDEYSNYRNQYYIRCQFIILIILMVFIGCILCILYSIVCAVFAFVVSQKEKEKRLTYNDDQI